MIFLKKRNKIRRHLLCAVTLRALVSVLIVALCFSVASVGVIESGASEVFLGSYSRKIPIYSVATEEKKIALSFDAAYGADKTEKIMEILSQYDAKATFFLVGFWVDKYGDTAKKIADGGFEIGTHSNTHAHMSKMSASDIASDLSLSISKIETQTGVKPIVFRAPYGEYNDTLIEEASKLNLYTVQWDVDSLDWKGISAEEIRSRVVTRAKEGSIVLFHNNSDHIVEALPGILELLKARGYTFCSVGELIYKDNYVIDNNGRQNPA